MKGCTTCKHVGGHTDEPPCLNCLPAELFDFPLWEASDQVKELIAEAEKRGFEAARKGNNVSDITDYQFIHVDEFKYQSYDQWKEANK